MTTTRTFEKGAPGFLAGLRDARFKSDDGTVRSIVPVTPEILSREGLADEIAAALVQADEALDPIKFIASTEAVARDGDIIRAKGWDLTNYRKNPQVLWSHNGYQTPIGKSIETKIVRKDEKVGPHLSALIDFVPFDDFARKVHRLYATGFLNAVSVGFRVMGYEVPADDDREGLGLGPWGIVVTRAELLDVSPVTVPSDPNALKTRAADGLERGEVDRPDLLLLARTLPPGEDRDSLADVLGCRDELYVRDIVGEIMAEVQETMHWAIVESLRKEMGRHTPLPVAPSDPNDDDPTSPSSGSDRPADEVPPERQGQSPEVPNYFETLETLARDLRETTKET